jgi:NDP-sugar pyrophosphorylase family protein
MLPVCGAPLIRWAALWLRAQGIREIVINLHHRGEQIAAELGDGQRARAGDRLLARGGRDPRDRRRAAQGLAAAR